MHLRLVCIWNVNRYGRVGIVPYLEDDKMSDKARELLERVLAGMDKYGDINYRTLEEIRAYLAKEKNKSDPDSIKLQSSCRGRRDAIV